MIPATVSPAIGPVKRRVPQPVKRRPCALQDATCAGPVARVLVTLDRALRYRTGYLPLCLAHRKIFRRKLC